MSVPADEQRRSMSVALYDLDGDWDDGVRAVLDEIAEVARSGTDAESAAVNLILDDEQFLVGRAGLSGERSPRDASPCARTVERHPRGGLVSYPDLRELPDLAGSPYLTGEIMAVRGYAAAVLVGKHGLALGTLCVLSREPGELAVGRQALLRQLARAAVNVLDERRRAGRGAVAPRAVVSRRPAGG